MAISAPPVQPANQTYKPATVWWFWAGIVVLLGLIFRVSIDEMLSVWLNVEEYSHGFFIPCITLYLIWIRRSELQLVASVKDSQLGLIVMLFGMLLFLLASLAVFRVFEQYAFLITLYGLFAVIFGSKGLRTFYIPLLFLLFMVPLPSFVLSNLSTKLQLISSWLGVEFIRTCDIMVYLEGNVIDLGSYKLQVVDACSGLRYLFPLSSLAFLCAYLYKGPIWQKWLVFLSSMPLTVFMNSFRIGVIGVMVDNWGTAMAEGFLHDFEGWVVFLLCMLLLFIEMWLLTRLSGRKQAFNELVQIPDAWLAESKTGVTHVVFNRSIFAVLLLLLVGGGISESIKGRVDIIPQRKAFVNFPAQIDSWVGHNELLGPEYLAQLKLTDYVITNYVKPGEKQAINFYSAYYQSQRKDAAVHSPRSCIPGDGWQIVQYEERSFPELQLEGQPLVVNRAIIEKGENRQLVYFWFQQRGRLLTNEYLVKWYLFYDAITLNRTDGALVRLVINLDKSEDPAVVEQRLQAFLKAILPKLPDYLPGKHVETAGVAAIE
ncbi:VPLPA-CTERM-specific exosortase XrtD [Methylomonas sp. AM2-LC]|uniref:VPLPA-CTERM-specific exosortase XrtD n=1 Tax=Methylomonas sp. AM2-LC TaxID=3153301 RepID=UPI003267DF63